MAISPLLSGCSCVYSCLYVSRLPYVQLKGTFKQFTTLHLSWIQPPPSTELRGGIKMAVRQSFMMLEKLWRPKKIYGSIDVLVSLRKLEATFEEERQEEEAAVAAAEDNGGARRRAQDEL